MNDILRIAIIASPSIAGVLWVIGMARQRRKELKRIFGDIRKTKRTYVLNAEGTAYVLKEKE